MYQGGENEGETTIGDDRSENCKFNTLTSRLTAMVGKFTHSAVNNDALKGIQAEQGYNPPLNFVRRNDTRWTSIHGMMVRAVRIKPPLDTYFDIHDSTRCLSTSEWEAVRQATGILESCMQVVVDTQGGDGGFVAESINSMMNLHRSFIDDFQEIRKAGNTDEVETIRTLHLGEEVNKMLGVLKEEVADRKLGFAEHDIEAACLVLHPHFRTCCEIVCRNGGMRLQVTVTNVIEGLLSDFEGHISPGTGTVTATTSAPAPSAPPKLTRFDRMRRQQDDLLSSAHGETPADTTQRTRASQALHEFEQYMIFPEARRNRDLLQFWRGHATEWPHIALFARLYVGVDSTSCQAERNFSALSVTLDSLRSSMSDKMVEQMMLLRLNKTLIPEIRAYNDNIAQIKSDVSAQKAAVQSKLTGGQGTSASEEGSISGRPAVSSGASSSAANNTLSVDKRRSAWIGNESVRRHRAVVR